MASEVFKFNLRAAAVILSLACGIVLAFPAIWSAGALAQSQPIIDRVVFENNKKVNDDILAQAVESKPRTIYNPATAAADIDRLREAYARAGRAAAAITYRAVPLPNNRVDVVFTVAEGEKIGVDEIVFVGNNAFSAWRLKRQMATSESGLLSWLRTTDTYDPDRMASDEERLRRFYVNRGYPDFRVVSIVPTLNEAQDAYVITITVDEGLYHTFGASTVESTIPEIPSESLTGEIRTSAGSTYDAENVDKTVEDMTDQLAREGFPFAQVRPRGERDTAGNSIGVTYVVEEGARVYIERINISGNTRTRDYVIRREFDVAEGDPYNKAMIDRALRRLRRQTIRPIQSRRQATLSMEQAVPTFWAVFCETPEMISFADSLATTSSMVALAPILWMAAPASIRQAMLHRVPASSSACPPARRRAAMLKATRWSASRT
jgi:outer membrane protein assembly complex protein YaeT